MATALNFDEAARLATLHKYSVLDTPREQGYDDVTSLATYLCETPYSMVALVDRDRQWFKSEVGFGFQETKQADAVCVCALLSPQTLMVPDMLLDTRFAESPLVTGDRGIRFYAGAPIVAPNGHILGAVGVFDTRPRTLTPIQMTALECLARQVMALFEARLRLVENERAAKALMQKEKLAAVGRLASSMAHAINNPLEAVTNLLYLTQQRVHDPEVFDWLRQAERELRRVSLIANQTLRFHKQASRPRAILCTELVSQTLGQFEAKLENARITVEKRKRTKDPIVCFEGDIRQVLGNIVDNAIDSMPGGGRLLLRTREGTDWRTGRKGWVITIADTGTGMDRETRKRLFEAFFSTKGIGGSGLGLWISAEIMERHRGEIAVRSSQRAPSMGTVVALFLPHPAMNGATLTALN
jgi:two-component system NtrC family sensor kinase